MQAHPACVLNERASKGSMQAGLLVSPTRKQAGTSGCSSGNAAGGAVAGRAFQLCSTQDPH